MKKAKPKDIHFLPRTRIEDDALLLLVRASAGASRDGVGGVHGDALKVAVTAAPERGKANRAILRVLAKELGLKRSAIHLHAGETSRDKWIRLEGVTSERLEEKLRRLVE